MKRHTKRRIIATLLAMTIALTDVSFGDTVTANAATTKAYGTEITQATMSVTMTTTDTKLLIIHDKDGNNMNKKNDSYIDLYEWSSSDNNIVMVDKMDDSSNEWCLLLKPTGEGTAVVTGRIDTYKNVPIDSDIRITVTVNPPKAKMTAKQKKCSHKYKVTKKATCERAGVKTCKKCKWQVTIAKKQHEYETKTLTYEKPKGQAWVLECRGVASGLCDETFWVMWDWDGNILPESRYKSFDEVAYAYSKHYSEVHGWAMSGYVDYNTPLDEWITVTEPVQICKHCNKKKYEIDLSEKNGYKM